MMITRESPATDPNAKLQSLPPQAGEGNVAWLARAPLQEGLLLLGGTSLVDFRLRFAQSVLRSDLTPSYWSVAGVVSKGGTVQTVPLRVGDPSRVPATNAVRRIAMAQFDDPEE